MLRLFEIALFLSPLAAWLIGRRLQRLGAPPRALLGGGLAAVLLLAAALSWLALRDGAPPGAVYVPAHVENGRIVPGRIVPPR